MMSRKHLKCCKQAGTAQLVLELWPKRCLAPEALSTQQIVYCQKFLWALGFQHVLKTWLHARDLCCLLLASVETFLLSPTPAALVPRQSCAVGMMPCPVIPWLF